MATELREETGLWLGDARPAEAVAIFDERRLAVVRRFEHPASFAEMAQVFARHQAHDPQRELDAILAITSRSQIDSRMPGYSQEIIRQFLP